MAGLGVLVEQRAVVGLGVGDDDHARVVVGVGAVQAVPVFVVAVSVPISVPIPVVVAAGAVLAVPLPLAVFALARSFVGQLGESSLALVVGAFASVSVFVVVFVVFKRLAVFDGLAGPLAFVGGLLC